MLRKGELYDPVLFCFERGRQEAHRSIKLPPQALIKVSCVVDAPSGLSYFSFFSLRSCIAADKDELILLRSYYIMHIYTHPYIYIVQHKYITFISFYTALQFFIRRAWKKHFCDFQHAARTLDEDKNDFNRQIFIFLRFWKHQKTQKCFFVCTKTSSAQQLITYITYANKYVDQLVLCVKSEADNQVFKGQGSSA